MSQHRARIRAAELGAVFHVTGCTCGWQVPDHDPDSDTAFAYHVALAQIPAGQRAEVHEAAIRKPPDLAALLLSATPAPPQAVAFLAQTLLEVVRASTPPGVSERTHAISVLTEVRDGLTRHLDDLERIS